MATYANNKAALKTAIDSIASTTMATIAAKIHACHDSAPDGPTANNWQEVIDNMQSVMEFVDAETGTDMQTNTGAPNKS